MTFLDMTPNENETKVKVNKGDYSKLKRLLHNKRNNQQNEETTYEMGEYI